MIDYCFNDRDVELLNDDIYTFNVLTRIMYLDCDLLVLLYKQNNFQSCTKGIYRVNSVE